MIRRHADPKHVAECLSLDLQTGELRWLKRPADHFSSAKAAAIWNGHWAGKPAFTHTEKGYRRGNLDGKPYKAHQIAYCLAHDVWPAGDIDHINGDRSDNRPANLRVVTHAVNMRNKRRYRNNSTGVAGVTRASRGHKYEAWIGADGRQRCLGRFETVAAAAEARRDAEASEGFHANHGAR
ncbi:HNH endonuclease signature motif containing protein [Sphingomonas paucimobilis]|uniref:HNH endonuclease signature motif containing protein n=1 Tax=Sphingomonas paucimobilis TaxID=13689 RepID=UPI0030F993C2